MNIETDDYTPEEVSKYVFKAVKEDLITDLNINIPPCIENAYITCYRINNEKKNPFLEYLLQLNDNFELAFPKCFIPNNCPDIKSLLLHINTNLSQLLMYNNINPNLKCDILNEYKGYCSVDNSLYMFYDLTDIPIQFNDAYKENELWFGLIDEILNVGHICNIPISIATKHFFTFTSYFDNPFWLLHNEYGDEYEIPVVVYIGTHEKKLNFIYTFGVSKKNDRNIFGSYYYFTNYTNAVRNIDTCIHENYKENDNKLTLDSKKGGVVRFALFLGKMCVKMNNIADDIDNSSIKKERLLDETLDLHYERLTMRISDYDGIWANNYDSVIINEITLDDGSNFKNAPIYVAKDYEQQCPLSYHYITKKEKKHIFDKK